MDEQTLRKIFEGLRSIAVIGANDSPGRPVDRVGRYLLQAGYELAPVHPVRKSVWGLPAWPRLTELPQPVDLVNVFRAPEFCLDHAREALALPVPPKVFWMQVGIRNAAAAALLAEHGILVVEDLCLMVEHARFLKMRA